MTNPSVHGGLLKVPPGVPDGHVLLRDGSFAARETLTRHDPRLEIYGGGKGIMLASGGIVPITVLKE